MPRLFKNFYALYKKEFYAYLHSLVAYIFIVVFLVVISWMYWKNLFLVGQTSMRDFFALLPWFFLFLIPALAMRIWSDEKRVGTIESLLTLPVSDWQVVLAKFGAATTFILVVLAISLPIPFSLSRLGDLDWGPVIGSYIGALLLGSAYLALGQWISALTKNQIVAFLITIAAAFIFLIVGLPFAATGSGVFTRVMYTISTYTHFNNFAKGVIDLRDLVYYLSFIGIFLFLNVYALNKRHFS